MKMPTRGFIPVSHGKRTYPTGTRNTPYRGRSGLPRCPKCGRFTRSYGLCDACMPEQFRKLKSATDTGEVG